MKLSGAHTIRKRFKVTGTGKITRRRGHIGHNLSKEARKVQIRRKTNSGLGKSQLKKLTKYL